MYFFIFFNLERWKHEYVNYFFVGEEKANGHEYIFIFNT